MKRIITLVFIVVFAITSFFSTEVRVGAAVPTKGTMQTSSFIQNKYYKDLTESDNYTVGLSFEI